MSTEIQMTKRQRLKQTTDSVMTLIKMQFKAGVKLPKGKTPIKTALKMLALLSAGVVLLGTFIAIYYFLALEFMFPKVQTDLGHEFLVFTLVGFQILQTLFLVPMLIKVLDINNDRELLLKLPVSSRQIFISKIVVAYLFEIVFAAAILSPILIAYGIAAGISWWFYLFIPVLLLFVPVLPFFLAIMAMFPIIKIVGFLRGRSWLTIILYFAGLILLILVYMYIVNGGVLAIRSQGFSSLLNDNAVTIQTAAKYFYPAKFFASLFGTAWHIALLNFMGIILSSAMLIAAACVVAFAKYKKIYMDERVTRSEAGRKSTLKLRSARSAVLEKDMLNIFRSSNYTFQFLLITVITPLLVYFCIKTAAYSVSYSFRDIGQIEESQNIIFGIAVFVIMILLPIASSFAASNISREGHNIYHTKTIPYAFRKQLLIKSGIVLIPILISVAVCTVITTLSHKFLIETVVNNITIAKIEHTVFGLTSVEALTVFGAAALMSIGYVALGTYLDLRRPVCNQLGTGELTKSTATINFIMVLGLAIGIGFGALGMFGGFAGTLFNVNFNETAIKGFFVGVSAVFAAVSLCLLLIDGPRKYYRLEQ